MSNPLSVLPDLITSLEQARKQQGLTYQALALASGLTPLAVRQALQGLTSPRITSVVALAQVLGLEVVIVPREVARGLQFGARSEAARVMTRVERLQADTAARDT